MCKKCKECVFCDEHDVTIDLERRIVGLPVAYEEHIKENIDLFILVAECIQVKQTLTQGSSAVTTVVIKLGPDKEAAYAVTQKLRAEQFMSATDPKTGLFLQSDN
jgi:hypothetical protein